MIAPRTIKIFEAYESGMSTAQISEQFDIDVFEIHRIIYRMRKHKKKKAAADLNRELTGAS